MANTVELRQARLVQMFSAKAAAQSSPEQLAELVKEVTSHRDLISYSQILSIPAFSKLAGTIHASSLDLLRLFAYGTWDDFKGNSGSFPTMVSPQVQKLKELTMISLALSATVLSYGKLQKDLDFDTVEDLESFLKTCVNLGTLKGKLNRRKKQLEIKYGARDLLPNIRGKVQSGQSFDTFLEEATPVSRNNETGLWSNGIVQQVHVPLSLDGSKFSVKVEFKVKGSRIFSRLIQHVTSTHAVHKSFGGKIYLGMFYVVGDDLFLRPHAVAAKSISATNSVLDYSVIHAIVKKFTALPILQNDNSTEVQYPVYMDDLLCHLSCDKKIYYMSALHKENPLVKAIDEAYAIFLMCHSTLLSTSAQSAVFGYTMKHHKSSSLEDQQSFRQALEVLSNSVQFVDELITTPLFSRLEQYARMYSTEYPRDGFGCFRLVKDWETHAPEHLTDQEKVVYTSVVRNYLVPHFYGNFLPQAIYCILFCYRDKLGLFDLKGFLKSLHHVSDIDMTMIVEDLTQLSLHGPPQHTMMTWQQGIAKLALDLGKLQPVSPDGPSESDRVAKWRILNKLRDRTERMYYKVLIDNLEEYAPIVYLPTARIVAQDRSCMFPRSQGMYFSAEDQGQMLSMLLKWPVDQIDMIVVTDASGMLGLDDLGAAGIGIVIGKMDLYVAAAGINPDRIIAVMIDVGTENEKLLKDCVYYGIQEHRLEGHEYLKVMDEFMNAVTTRWPNVIVQFEDFKSECAVGLLNRYRQTFRMFNDDIQGTAAVTIAGFLGALRTQGKPLSEFPRQRIVVAGVDSATTVVLDAAIRLIAKMTGINTFTIGSARQNVALHRVRRQFWIVDVQGLITDARADLDSELALFARNKSELTHQCLSEGASLAEVVEKVKPDVILELSAAGGILSNEVFEALKDSSSPRPAILTTSNQQKKGNDKIGHSNHGNTLYIFPGLVLGTLLSGAQFISERMLLAAAKGLTSYMKEEEVLQGIIYPPASRIRDIAKAVAAAVISEALLEGLAQGCHVMNVNQLAKLSEEQIVDYVQKNMWIPVYPT